MQNNNHHHAAYVINAGHQQPTAPQIYQLQPVNFTAATLPTSAGATPTSKSNKNKVGPNKSRPTTARRKKSGAGNQKPCGGLFSCNSGLGAISWIVLILLIGAILGVTTWQIHKSLNSSSENDGKKN